MTSQQPTDPMARMEINTSQILAQLPLDTRVRLARELADITQRLVELGCRALMQQALDDLAATTTRLVAELRQQVSPPAHKAGTGPVGSPSLVPADNGPFTPIPGLTARQWIELPELPKAGREGQLVIVDSKFYSWVGYRGGFGAGWMLFGTMSAAESDHRARYTVSNRDPVVKCATIRAESLTAGSIHEPVLSATRSLVRVEGIPPGLVSSTEGLFIRSQNSASEVVTWTVPRYQFDIQAALDSLPSIKSTSVAGGVGGLLPARPCQRMPSVAPSVPEAVLPSTPSKPPHTVPTPWPVEWPEVHEWPEGAPAPAFAGHRKPLG